MSVVIDKKVKPHKQGGSKTITIPKRWLDIMEYIKGEKIDEVHLIADGILVVAPDEETAEKWKITIEYMLEAQKNEEVRE